MGILGKKIGMTQVLKEDGTTIPVTVINVEGNIVTEIKTEEKNGYNAVQVGFEKPKKVKKPQLEMFKEKNIEPRKYLKEFKDIDQEKFKIGDEIGLDHVTEYVDIKGKTKGKGFQGTIKRHKGSTGRKTHGSHFHRAPGSIGASADPAKVVKGMPMAGQMGNTLRTIQNLKVVKKDSDRNLLFVKGSVPGAKNTLLYIYNSAKKNS